MRTVYFFGGPHPINETYISTPPGGFEIKSNLSSNSFKSVGEYTVSHNYIKSAASFVYDTFKLPRVIYLPNDCDLIHTSGGVIPLNKKPYVIKVEHASSFFNLNDDRLYNESWNKSLLKWLSKSNCKKILPYSEATKKSLQNALGPEFNNISDKVEVVYPAIDIGKIHTKNRYVKDGNFIKLLFVSRHFFDDGGRELVEAFKILEQKYDIKLDIITNPPSHHASLFEEYVKTIKSNNVNIIKEKLPRDILFEKYYSQSDIFVLASYIHFFGYVALEAMTQKLPIITTNVYAMKELVENEKNGFIIESPISCFNDQLLKPQNFVHNYNHKLIQGVIPEVVSQLVEKIQILIENDDLRRKMGQESLKMVQSGKFSIEHRNAQLKRIYDEALKS